MDAEVQQAMATLARVQRQYRLSPAGPQEDALIMAAAAGVKRISQGLLDRLADR